MTYDRNTPILGAGTVSAEAIQAWFASIGPTYAATYAPDRTYRPAPPSVGQDIVAVCREWGINHDVMAAQIAHESAAWQSAIVRDKHNPSGLGATNDNAYAGAVTFATPAEGIRATAAHLLVYARGEGPWAQYDPRADAVRLAGWLGVARTWGDLNGRWAYPGRTYAEMVTALANQLVDFANNGVWEPVMEAQIPGFRWYPAAKTHYTAGRGGVRIRGGAQHYSAGTDSLPWLTSTSGRDDPARRVSAHFLVRRNATPAFRGWQLVRLEDTAWTTAFANPYTVSIEYEHLASQDIPDGDYEVLAQTWADVTRYVAQHTLGAIETVAGHKTWVNNPSLVCPDGIDVARVVRRWQELMVDQPQRPADVTDPEAEYVAATGAWLQSGFRGFWRGNPDALRWLGWPVENERTIGAGLALQRFERGWLLYDATQPEPWRVHVLPLSRYSEFGVTP